MGWPLLEHILPCNPGHVFHIFFRLAIPRWITAVITAEMQSLGMFARETTQRGSGLASEKVLQHPKARSPSPACHLLWTSSHAFGACMSKLVLRFVVASATPAGVVNVCHLRSFWVSYAFFFGHAVFGQHRCKKIWSLPFIPRWTVLRALTSGCCRYSLAEFKFSRAYEVAHVRCFLMLLALLLFVVLLRQQILDSLLLAQMRAFFRQETPINPGALPHPALEGPVAELWPTDCLTRIVDPRAPRAAANHWMHIQWCT